MKGINFEEERREREGGAGCRSEACREVEHEGSAGGSGVESDV